METVAEKISEFDGIPVEERDDVKCRHGCQTAAMARFSVPEGCACFPDDREQDLCGQHYLKDGSIGGMVTLRIYLLSTYKLLTRS